MSSREDIYGSIVYDVPKTRTRCKVKVYSHVDENEWKGVSDCSRDVISLEVSKTIKSGGGASFVLVPREDYLNRIFPFDYVNIYVDMGDGRGWIRTFFGFVDRVSRTVQTEENGTTVTRYLVACSDVTKALENNAIYFNPGLAFRDDLIDEFGANNLGGSALRTQGIAIHGSPADIMMNMIFVLLGMRAQFAVPKCYSSNISMKIIDKNRKARKDWAKSRLDDTIKKSLGVDTLKRYETFIREQAAVRIIASGLVPIQGPSDLLTGPIPKELLAEATVQSQNPSVLNSIPTGLIDRAIPVELESRENPGNLFQSQQWLLNINVEESTQNGTPISLIDLIDFRYVEWETIDGEVISASIQENEGTLWSMVNSWSNGDFNELFFDLRPMPSEPTPGGSGSGGGKQDRLVTSNDYGRDSDERGDNEGAIRYAPCIVMREYPFGTIDSITLPPSVRILEKSIAAMPIGALFSKEPGKSGRKTVEIPALHPALAQKGGKTGKKSLDVIAISVNDIISENIGRSDSGVVNVIEVYSDVSGDSIKFMQREVLPITIGTSIQRHGLRLMSQITKFARFSTEYRRTPDAENFESRRISVRFAFLLDHWYQHSSEYLNGTFSMRGMPEIRVGYRLDITERKESYYVEGVNHSWTYPGSFLTTVTVSRGQRYDPYLAYVMPQRPGMFGERRMGKGRLDQYFEVMHPSAVVRSSMSFGPLNTGNQQGNTVDSVSNKRLNVRGYIASGGEISQEERDFTELNKIVNESFHIIAVGDESGESVKK